MKTDSIHSDEEKLAARYEELIKPMFKANLVHMHYLVEEHGIDALVQEARKVLRIPKKGRKPNTDKTYAELLYKNPQKLPVLLLTTSLEERGILYDYVDKIIHDFNVYEHFRECLADYIIHNIIGAPTHNVTLKSNLNNIGRNVLPDIHFYRSPYVNDWEIAKILLYRYQKALPAKFTTSYRGKRNLKKNIKLLKDASNRTRVEESKAKDKEIYKITDKELAFEYFNDTSKVETLKKTLSRDRKRTKEIAKPAR